jgi:hypothetical protein
MQQWKSGMRCLHQGSQTRRVMTRATRKTGRTFWRVGALSGGDSVGWMEKKEGQREGREEGGGKV